MISKKEAARWSVSSALPVSDGGRSARQDNPLKTQATNKRRLGRVLVYLLREGKQDIDKGRQGSYLDGDAMGLGILSMVWDGMGWGRVPPRAISFRLLERIRLSCRISATGNHGRANARGPFWFLLFIPLDRLAIFVIRMGHRRALAVPSRAGVVLCTTDAPEWQPHNSGAVTTFLVLYIGLFGCILWVYSIWPSIKDGRYG
jgi:hypothetical protein